MDTMHEQAAPVGLRTTGSTFWAAITAALAVTTAAFGGEISPNFLYGIDDANVIWKIDPIGLTSGTVGQVAMSNPASTYANALALDNRGNLFAVDGESNLWCVNDTNLSGVQILASGSLGLPTGSQFQPRSAAIYDDAYWFFVGDDTTGSTELRKLTLDYSSGAPQVTGFASYDASVAGLPNTFGDIAITPTGMLYAYTSGAASRFYKLDLTTIGSGTTVGGFEEIVTSGSGVNTTQIASYPDGNVYANVYDTGYWYTVNTTTGALSPVLTSSGTFQTLAADNKGFRDLGGSAIQAVPEPDTLALAAMGGGVLAWQVSRRRRKPNGGADAVGPDEPFDADDVT